MEGHSGSDASGHKGGYNVGDKIEIECKKDDGSWGSGPICAETGYAMAFKFGVDSSFHCGWAIADKERLGEMSAIINREKAWECRVAMSPEKQYYLPLVLPLWGIAEATHIHVDNHMNLVFHADHGRVIGVTAYPLLDQFQFAKEGAIIQMHGVARWFRRHTYHAFGSGQTPHNPSSVSHFYLIFSWSFLSSIITLLAASVFYSRSLKPKLIKKYLKRD